MATPSRTRWWSPSSPSTWRKAPARRRRWQRCRRPSPTAVPSPSPLRVRALPLLQATTIPSARPASITVTNARKPAASGADTSTSYVHGPLSIGIGSAGQQGAATRVLAQPAPHSVIRTRSSMRHGSKVVSPLPLDRLLAVAALAGAVVVVLSAMLAVSLAFRPSGDRPIDPELEAQPLRGGACECMRRQLSVNCNTLSG